MTAKCFRRGCQQAAQILPSKTRITRMVRTNPNPPVGPYPQLRLCGQAGSAPSNINTSKTTNTVPNIMRLSESACGRQPHQQRLPGDGPSPVNEPASCSWQNDTSGRPSGAMGCSPQQRRWLTPACLITRRIAEDAVDFSRPRWSASWVWGIGIYTSRETPCFQGFSPSPPDAGRRRGTGRGGLFC